MNLYWIKAEGVRLAIIQCPRGPEWLRDDISFLLGAGFDVVVSALTAAENDELGLIEESRCCQDSGIEFLFFPIEDRCGSAHTGTGSAQPCRGNLLHGESKTALGRRCVVCVGLGVDDARIKCEILPARARTACG